MKTYRVSPLPPIISGSLEARHLLTARDERGKVVYRVSVPAGLLDVERQVMEELGYQPAPEND